MEDEIDLGRLLGTLWRGIILILFSGFVLMMIGAWYAFSVAVPVYTANSIVALESREQNVMDIENVVAGLSGDQSTINTEVEVIRSRILIERLVLDLGLVDDAEFNKYLRTPPKISLKIAIAYVQEQIFGPSAPEPAPTERAVLDTVIDSVLKSIKVSNVRSSFVFRISTVTEQKRKSAAMANRLAELYIEDQIRVKFDKTAQATKWLGERVAELQVSLEADEEALKSFSSNTDLISPESLIALNRQLKEFRDRRNSLQLSIATQAENATQLEASAKAADYKAFEVRANDRTFSLILQNPGENETVKALNLATQAERVVSKYKLDLQRAQSQLVAVESSILEVTTRIDRQSDELVKLQQMQREAEASRLIYEAFLSRLKETSIQQGIQQADSRILSNAVVPTLPTAPRKTRIMAGMMILGFLIGAAIVLTREMSQNTFRIVEDLEAKTGVSVLGQIPVIPARRRASVIKYLTDKPNSAAAEAIRNLRTSVLLANVDKNPQIIMSTSSVPGEGKTTQSIALTQNFAGLGEKVLLIEGDIRRRVFKDYFDIKSDKGFLSVLSGAEKLEDVIVSNDMLKADILMGDKSSVNPADLYSSKKFENMLKDLRKKYDRIIIDTPPVLAVPDARVIGQAVDSIVYTVKWDSTSHRQVLDGLKALETVNVKVSGLVLGQINKRGMKRYGYGDNYGSYQGYYDN